MSQSKFSTKAIDKIMKFVNMKGIVALKEGMLNILPLTVVGSIFLIIGSLPSEHINNFIAGIFGQNWTEPFLQVQGGTFAIMGIVSCFAIAYHYAKNEGHEALPAGILALSSFFIITNSYMVTDKGDMVKDVISKTWTGGQGMITAIIVGLFVGYSYSWFMKRDIVIKLPESVPKAISNQFAALIPATFIFLVSMIVYIIFKFGFNTTFIEWIYQVLQVPLQGLTDSLPGVIAIAFFISFLWWFGVHGQSVVNGIVCSLLTANAVENTEMLQATGKLVVGGGAHIVTQQFLDSFLLISGSGITFGIVIAMLFRAKSNQYKSLGKLSIVPAIFNINEPVTFGLPIVLNPIMFVPFVAVPVIAALIVYGSIAVGFLKPFSGVLLPWSTPFLISGLMVGGWKGCLIQVIILLMSCLVYYPFFKKQDQIAYQQEQEAAVQQGK
ncbi:PTS sugar transporter subunit IIC [Sporanaerobacter sp. PP17-6a]|uniref:PTS sugar transporter subunit IIC n=1 Tax=Sporanaerobacter sp. PP17-6a TaxID=1891289 RepID=UPI0008A03704|nr:PTS sugar transporter subunit IIC [Sporanaerobacter sp. PP17-6a]SCL91479.1 PTS system lichenan-specific EIIC component [Sporanaerobacter sp. PP17-6a]